MKTRLFALLFSLPLFFSCKPKNTDTVDVQKMSDTMTLKEAHNSQNSLDWQGTYKGILPCADCEGIETVLLLNGEGTFVLQTKYLGKGIEKPKEATGSFAWNTSGNTIALAGIEDGPSQYFVGENQLRQLDLSGNRIEGDLADKYILVKQ